MQKLTLRLINQNKMALDLENFKLPQEGTDPSSGGALNLDQFKVQQDQPQEQQQPGLFQGLVQGITKPFAKIGVTAAKLVGTTAGLAGAGVRYLAGDKEGAKQSVNSISKDLNTPVDLGYLGKVRPMGVDDNGNELSTGDAIKESIGTGAEIGSYFLGGGAVKEGVKDFAKASIGQTVKQGIKGGVISGGIGSAGAEATNKDSTATSIAGQGLMGSILVGATGGAVPLFAKSAQGVYSGVKNIVNPEIEAALTRAIKPGKNNVGFSDHLKLAVPEISDTLKLKGVDPAKMTINDLKDAVLDTKKRIWDAYEKVKSPNNHAQIDTTPIADKMKSTITPRFREQNPGLAQKIETAADTYNGRELSVGEIENRLQEANGELHSYYAKNKVSQQVAKSDPEIAHVVNEANGLRDLLYSKLDELSGGKSGDIKKLYGALTNIGNEVEGRAQVYNRQAPASLQETLNYPWAVAKGVGSVMRGDPLGAAESLTQIGISKAMKEGNSTDGLIRKAFTKASKNGNAKVMSTGNQMEEGLARKALPPGRPLGTDGNPIITPAPVAPTTFEKAAPPSTGYPKATPFLRLKEGTSSIPMKGTVPYVGEKGIKGNYTKSEPMKLLNAGNGAIPLKGEVPYVGEGQAKKLLYTRVK